MRKNFIIISVIAILLIGVFFTFEITKNNSKEDKTVKSINYLKIMVNKFI